MSDRSSPLLGAARGAVRVPLAGLLRGGASLEASPFEPPYTFDTLTGAAATTTTTLPPAFDAPGAAASPATLFGRPISVSTNEVIAATLLTAGLISVFKLCRGILGHATHMLKRLAGNDSDDDYSTSTFAARASAATPISDDSSPPYTSLAAALMAGALMLSQKRDKAS